MPNMDECVAQAAAMGLPSGQSRILTVLRDTIKMLDRIEEKIDKIDKMLEAMT